MATRILAVLNQKGGVGKTTTCVNLAAALALLGKRVLLVDMDPQANLTVHVGLEPHELSKTTYSLLLGRHNLAEAVRETDTPGLRVVPSTLALANAEIQLASTVGRELVLREALDEYLEGPVPTFGAPSDAPAAPADTSDHGADFVIIDCPPSLGTLTMNALCAANEVLLPIQTEFFALQGVAGILESVKAVQRLNRGLRLSMVVPSMVDRRTTLARDVIAEVRDYFGELVTDSMIRKNVKLAEAPSHGKTIFGYEPRCNGAADYLRLGREVLGLPLDDDTPIEIPTAAAVPAATPVEEPTPVEETPPAEAAIPSPAPPPAAVPTSPPPVVDTSPTVEFDEATAAPPTTAPEPEAIPAPTAETAETTPGRDDEPVSGEPWIRLPAGVSSPVASPAGSATTTSDAPAPPTDDPATDATPTEAAEALPVLTPIDRIGAFDDEAPAEADVARDLPAPAEPRATESRFATNPPTNGLGRLPPEAEDRPAPVTAEPVAEPVPHTDRGAEPKRAERRPEWDFDPPAF